MQRLHPEDIAARLIATGDWEVIELPAIAATDRVFKLGSARTLTFRAGDYLQPDREGRTELDEMRRAMGTVLFNAQYLQAPQDMAGGVVLSEWIHRYDGTLEPRATDYVLQSWDVAISDDVAADWSVCTTWIRRSGVSHLVDVWRGKRSLPELLPIAMQQAQLWSVDEVIIETDGVGLAFYQALIARVRDHSGDRGHRRAVNRGDTLPGRVTNALQLVEVLIRDDLYSEPAHRGDYETAALSNELQQNDDWGTLAFEAMRAERQGRDIDNLAALLSRASVYQTREFPRYRAGYAKQAHGKVWEDDIAVSVRGGRSDTLRLTGPVFAANRNIADLQRALTEGASRVRFKRVEYQAFQGGPLTFFDLETPGDDEVGVWVGSEFMSASKPSRAEEASMLNPRSVER